MASLIFSHQNARLCFDHGWSTNVIHVSRDVVAQYEDGMQLQLVINPSHEHAQRSHASIVPLTPCIPGTASNHLLVKS